MTKQKFDLYQMITDKIVAQLEAGKTPWRQPWRNSGGVFGTHRNLVTRKPYRGINALITSMAGYSTPYWVSYKQAAALSGNVRKGEHGTQVVFWSLMKREETTATGETSEKKIPFVKYSTVFNVSQCDGLTVPETVSHGEIALDVRAEAAIAAWGDKPKIFHGGDRAFYRPLADEVHVPLAQSFTTADGYYGTLFHELVHSTGSDGRLNRFKPTEGQFTFGSDSYSQEELVAEIGSAFIAGRLGIALDEQNNAAYLRNWLTRLKSDKKFIFTAARDAQKATDHILGEAVAETDEEHQDGNGDAVAA